MLERIILHWTAGTHRASDTDLEHYHLLIEGDGTVVKGKEKPEDNVVTSDGDYAAHVLNLNTGSIGAALCGMRGAIESPFDPGPYPIHKPQFLSGCEAVARLALLYGIPVTRRTVLTHAEVEPTLGVKQRGKWDLTRLPWMPSLRGALAVGDYMRAHVLAHGEGRPLALPYLMRGDRGEEVRRLQFSLVSHGAQIKADGAFGPQTERAVTSFQDRAGLVVDGIVGPKTWEALR